MYGNDWVRTWYWLLEFWMGTGLHGFLQEVFVFVFEKAGAGE
jgi:hypothetical protein